jgi:hypothetical protein
MAKPKRNRSLDYDSFNYDAYMADLQEDNLERRRNKKNKQESTDGLSKKAKKELKEGRRLRQTRGEDFFTEDKD